jgi:NAD(P)H-hydrate epimerase
MPPASRNTSFACAASPCNFCIAAVDIPSGLNADTGNIMSCAVVADITISFIVLKKGLFTGLAANYCGTVIFADLEVPDTIIQAFQSHESLLTPAPLTRRKVCSHKGDYGHSIH